MRSQGIGAGVVATALMLVVSSSASADSSLGLQAYWKLNESSGTLANDSVGPYDATLTNNAAFVSDPQRGHALSPGSGGALVSGASPVQTDAGTILAWAKLTDTSGYNFMFDTVDYSTPAEPRIYIYSIEGTFKIGLGNNSAFLTSATFDTGNWHQVALSWEASSPGSGSGSFTAYFDGQPVQGSLYSGLSSLGSYLSIGSQYYPPGNVFGSSVKGSMSEAGVWNRALTDQEVLDIYTAGYITAPAVPGDINGDGLVNLTDYGLLKASFFQTVTAGTNGDLNGDSKVDLTDFVIFKNNYQEFNGGGSGAELAAVPEPGTIVLMAAALPAWLLLRRRSRHSR